MDKPTKASRLPKHYWTYERIALAASEFSTRVAFRRGNNSAYQAALRKKIMNQVCTHMERLCRAPWTKEELIALASRYNTRNHFKIGAAGAYMTCHKWGWMDEVCAHMKKPKKQL